MTEVQKQEVEAMRTLELKLFIIEFNKASQLDRSFGKSLTRSEKRTLRNVLIETCLDLMSMVDTDTFTKSALRNRIGMLMTINENISYGQAQKVVNVVLKQYCFILGKVNLYKELDCPLDSTTMRGRHSMKDLTKEQYEAYQSEFEGRHDGLRILEDMAYDTQRIQTFEQG